MPTSSRDIHSAAFTHFADILWKLYVPLHHFLVLINNSLKREAVPLTSEITLLQTLYDMQRIFINYRPHSYNWFFYLLDLPPYRLFLSCIFLKLNSRCMPFFLFWTLPLLFFFKQKLLCCSRIFFYQYVLFKDILARHLLKGYSGGLDWKTWSRTFSL